MGFFQNIFNSRRRSDDGNFSLELESILGFKIKNQSLYIKAFTHRSMNLRNEEGITINYERLEFLGDAMLGTIVSAFLYRHFSEAKEGELTNLRAKIVSRENLNAVGTHMKLLEQIESTHPRASFGIDINGNLLEALVGAVFLSLIHI